MGNPREAQQSSSSQSAGGTSGDPSPPSGSDDDPPQPPTFLETVSRTVSRVASLSRTSSEHPSLQAGRRAAGDRSNSDNNNHHQNQRRVENVPVTPEVRDRTSVMVEDRRTYRSVWPNKSSSFFACLSCVLGMHNINRFSMLVFLYKGPFIVEFIILSLVFGIPFLFLQMTLGQYLGAGLLDMWFISPAFKGLGVALLYTYVVISVYTAVPISWMYIYFKDSFITARETYKWGLCYPKFAFESCSQSENSTSQDYLGWSVPSYFHDRVLDRKPDNFELGELKFEIAFNLSIVWLLVFICLSKGLRSYGKVVYVLGIMPLTLLLLVSIRFLEEWGEGVVDIFLCPWKPILADSWSWLLAAREVFLTWGLFGAVALQMCSHNKTNYTVMKNLVCLSVITMVTLILSSFFLVSAVNVLNDRKLLYLPTSYESEITAKVVHPFRHYPPPSFNVSAVNLLVGESLLSFTLVHSVSGYQPLRFATEIFPAALGAEGVRSISSFWSICFYGMMILFGLGQLMAVWCCVMESIISVNPKLLRPWQTVLTFLFCASGLLLGLPMSSNLGIYIVYFIDFCVGALWWIAALYLVMLVAVLLIRGRPYGTDQLVSTITKNLNMKVWLMPALTFQWNIILPVSYLVLSIAFLRTGHPGATFSWADQAQHYRYWPLWVKKLTSAIQIFPLLITVIVCLYQAYRYLTPKSEQPLHERVQSWCCPMFSTVVTTSPSAAARLQTSPQGVVNSAFEEDPPPKYTPPPSYSTATAKLIAKQLLHQTNSGIELGFVEVDLTSPTTGYQSSGLDGVLYTPNQESEEVVITQPLQNAQRLYDHDRV